MLEVYGIKNCNTVKKALAWLNDHGVEHRFHDFKKEGVDQARLRHWVEQVGWETLLNRKGLTWRRLPEDRRAQVNDADTAIALMLEKPTVIKRPVIERGDEVLAVGFDEARYAERLA